MWLVGFRKKNIKSLSFKTFLIPKMFFKKAISEKLSSFQKLILTLLQQVFILKDLLRTFMIRVHYMTGQFKNWLTTFNMGEFLQHFQILTINLYKGKNYSKSLVSMPNYQTFEVFMEAIKYALLEVTITILRIFTPIFVFKSLNRVWVKVVKNIKTSWN